VNGQRRLFAFYIKIILLAACIYRLLFHLLIENTKLHFEALEKHSPFTIDHSPL